MRSWKRNWILRRMVLGFAVAALVVPAAAQARVDEGISGQPNLAGEISIDPQARMTVSDSNAVSNVGSVNPQARMTVSDSNAVSSVGSVNPQARMTVRDSNAALKVATPSTSVVSSPGFSWGDAGIGALLAFGLLGIGFAAYRASRHLGSPQTA